MSRLGKSCRILTFGAPGKPRIAFIAAVFALVLWPAWQQSGAADVANPFARRAKVAPWPDSLSWLNTDRPLSLQELRGKFVLLDFWTYCCINCMHILPELQKLEEAYPNELVVIGVHSAKFETERDSQNIEDAILRYEIQHPVINDADHKLWGEFGVRSWPTIFLIDPEGYAVWGRSGEFLFEEVDRVLNNALPFYRQRGLVDAKPLKYQRLAGPDTPLRFPGKILADELNGRLFIADSNHNRIVMVSLGGDLLATMGSGAPGSADGDFGHCQFNHPQGMALSGNSLFVADTENHLIRVVDLGSKQISTVAGTGKQSRLAWPAAASVRQDTRSEPRFAGDLKTVPLASPWALSVHDQVLYIAMAGTHQIWKMRRDGSEISLHAGNGREDIVDGRLVPPQPYYQAPADAHGGLLSNSATYASFAQPSGLAADDEWLYVADSEGSSIRAVPFDTAKSVRTVVGTAALPSNRLFTFGDKDGPQGVALFQHPLDVACRDGQLYVADTYNDKIRVVDARTGATRTLAGGDQAAPAAAAPPFDEPGGLTVAGKMLYVADTNHHVIRTVELGSGRVGTLELRGLTPPSGRNAP